MNIATFRKLTADLPDDTDLDWVVWNYRKDEATHDELLELHHKAIEACIIAAEADYCFRRARDDDNYLNRIGVILEDLAEAAEKSALEARESLYGAFGTYFPCGDDCVIECEEKPFKESDDNPFA